MRPIPCVEGEPFTVEPALQSAVRSAARRLKTQLLPTLPRILTQDGDQFTFSGIIGTVSVSANVLFEIVPKTEPGDDWIHAVLDLLVGTERIDAAGERAAGLSNQRRSLLEVLAAIYASRLQRALRRDGPILLIERHHADLAYLKGKLQVTPWVRRAAWQPHRLPVAFDRLTADHDFSRALATVARLLAGVSRSAETRSVLLEASRGLRPGFAEDVPPARSVLGRPLPPQWSIYHPAWSIAVAVLAQRALLGRVGQYQGVSIAIEAWPLLERLLQRSLAAAVSRANGNGRQLTAPGKHTTALLEPLDTLAGPARSVEPDGRLMEARQTVATFEAKYKRRGDSWPPREDIFQALATAAACGSPLAVLVYPDEFPTCRWRVRGFRGRPQELAAVGLGLFTYRSGGGDEERGARILDLMRPGNQVAAGPPGAQVELVL